MGLARAALPEDLLCRRRQTKRRRSSVRRKSRTTKTIFHQGSPRLSGLCVLNWLLAAKRYRTIAPRFCLLGPFCSVVDPVSVPSFATRFGPSALSPPSPFAQLWH